MRHTMKMLELVEAQFHYSLTLALDGGKCSASSPVDFFSSPPPRERVPDSHWIAGCVGPKASPDAEANIWS